MDRSVNWRRAGLTIQHSSSLEEIGCYPEKCYFPHKGRVARERKVRTLVEILSEEGEMEGGDRRTRSHRRLRLACDMSSREGFEEGEHVINSGSGEPGHTGSGQEPGCVGSRSGMNLATALAVERTFRAESVVVVGPTGAASHFDTPARMSLMSLMEEMDGQDEEITDNEGRGARDDSMCCVCLGRTKGAAFIPCGHTFCRVCSREIWLNRGCCPLCNRLILEILDIY